MLEVVLAFAVGTIFGGVVGVFALAMVSTQKWDEQCIVIVAANILNMTGTFAATTFVLNVQGY